MGRSATVAGGQPTACLGEGALCLVGGEPMMVHEVVDDLVG